MACIETVYSDLDAAQAYAAKKNIGKSVFAYHYSVYLIIKKYRVIVEFLGKNAIHISGYQGPTTTMSFNRLSSIKERLLYAIDLNLELMTETERSLFDSAFI